MEKSVRDQEGRLFPEAPPGVPRLSRRLRDRDRDLPEVLASRLQIAPRRKGQDVGCPVLPEKPAVEPPYLGIGGEQERHAGAGSIRIVLKPTQQPPACRGEFPPRGARRDHLYRPHPLR